MTDLADETIVVDCELDAAPDKVWRAVTVPELAEQWITDDRERHDGRSYTLLDAEPCTRVRYAWTDRASSEPETVVTIDLTPTPDGRTRFRLTHSIAAREPLCAANTNRPHAMVRAA
ncbi:SRPBCC domain-containing protein [Mesorhizobium sp. CAU 1732]|uniref:SRPBCC family protein n=1 Tax=Mesorhizobium sp. CAU 1732 TaxID=3140358 RepID=UPI00326034BB